jgi:hypothetical protein
MAGEVMVGQPVGVAILKLNQGVTGDLVIYSQAKVTAVVFISNWLNPHGVKTVEIFICPAIFKLVHLGSVG